MQNQSHKLQLRYHISALRKGHELQGDSLFQEEVRKIVHDEQARQALQEVDAGKEFAQLMIILEVPGTIKEQTSNLSPN
jgi:hypothetical protein